MVKDSLIPKTLVFSRVFDALKAVLSTICLQTPLVYKTLEDPRSLLLHILCVMRIEILRDGRVRMTEAGGNVNGLRAGFDQNRSSPMLCQTP